MSFSGCVGLCGLGPTYGLLVIMAWFTSIIRVHPYKSELNMFFLNKRIDFSCSIIGELYQYMIANHHRVIVPLLAALFTNVTYALDVNSELDTEAIACNHKESWMQEAKKDIPDSSGYSIVAKTFEAQQRRGTASLVYDLWVGLEKTVEGKQQRISAICLPGRARS